MEPSAGEFRSNICLPLTVCQTLCSALARAAEGPTAHSQWPRDVVEEAPGCKLSLGQVQARDAGCRLCGTLPDPCTRSACGRRGGRAAGAFQVGLLSSQHQGCRGPQVVVSGDLVLHTSKGPPEGVRKKSHFIKFLILSIK